MKSSTIIQICSILVLAHGSKGEDPWSNFISNQPRSDGKSSLNGPVKGDQTSDAQPFNTLIDLFSMLQTSPTDSSSSSSQSPLSLIPEALRSSMVSFLLDDPGKYLHQLGMVGDMFAQFTTPKPVNPKHLRFSQGKTSFERITNDIAEEYAPRMSKLLVDKLSQELQLPYFMKGVMDRMVEQYVPPTVKEAAVLLNDTIKPQYVSKTMDIVVEGINPDRVLKAFNKAVDLLDFSFVAEILDQVVTHSPFPIQHYLTRILKSLPLDKMTNLIDYLTSRFNPLKVKQVMNDLASRYDLEKLKAMLGKYQNSQATSELSKNFDALIAKVDKKLDRIRGNMDGVFSDILKNIYLWIYEKRNSLRKIILGPYVDEWDVETTTLNGPKDTEFVIKPTMDVNYDIHPKDVIASNSLAEEAGYAKQIPVTTTVLGHDDDSSVASSIMGQSDSHSNTEPDHTHNLVAINLYYS